MAVQIRAAWAILKKDLAVWRRSPAAIFTSLLPPLVLLLILGLAAAAVTTLPVAVVNLDAGAAARVMERTALGFSGFRAAEMSPAQADRAFTRLAVSAVLTIPAGFSADLAAPTSGRVPGRPQLSFRVRNFNADATDDLHRDVATVVGRSAWWLA